MLSRSVSVYYQFEQDEIVFLLDDATRIKRTAPCFFLLLFHPPNLHGAVRFILVAARFSALPSHRESAV